MGLIASIRREALYIWRLTRTLLRVRRATSDPRHTFVDDLEVSADRFADRPAFIFEGETWTYARFDAHANRVANWARGLGLTRGDTVALLMRNRPDYVAIWHGLAKVGVVTALVNNQLTGNGLAHCLSIAEAGHLICEPALADALEEARPHLEAMPKLWLVDGASEGAEDFDAALAGVSSERPPRELREETRASDTALKIYTSGTTGLPKAARVTHFRALIYMHVFSPAANASEKDRVMLALPLYHATGGLCGVGLALTNGGAVVLERRFSASRFWDVAADSGATLFMYVGELCRFLAAAPSHPKEHAHKIRCAVGNGLRPDVWKRFQTRFGIDRIIEFYGATEGNVSLMNVDGTVGAIGRIPWYARHRFNVRIVRYDVERDAIVRGPDGLCIEAATGEIGETIGEIDPSDPRYRFDGYEGKAEQTEKKILHDVFTPGDAWFRTGDLMRTDKHGYFYFVDRVGDTFRWKSENVATSEVAEAIASFPSVSQANVYGVPVPGYDGKAGMAAMVAAEDVDLVALHAHLERELPAFARPIFIRLQRDQAANATGTFKLRKVELVKEGFDPEVVADPLYFDDPREGRYVGLDKALYEALTGGHIRL